MNKVYSRINWKNYPSVDTAVNESNLNRMDYAIDEIDKRVVEHDTTKLDVETANSMVRNVSFNERSGIFTITYLNGSTKELDTKLEKIAVNFEYDAERQKLILELIDGTYQEIDMAALITEYEFENSAYISWTVDGGKVKAEIIGGSITEDMLQPNFLADCRLYAGNAEESALRAEEYAEKAEENAGKYQDITSVINQASKSWVMPTDIQITHYGVGEVGNEEFSDAGEYYLDVVSGNVYVSDTTMVEEITTPGGDIIGEKITYMWNLDRTLVNVQDELEAIQRKMPKVVNTNVTLTNGKATVYMNQLVETDIQRVLSVSGFGQEVLPTFYVSSGAYSDYRIVVYASNLASSASTTARIAINYIEY